MKAIVAIAQDLGIGKNGDLLFRIPSDLKHFRAETLGKTCIMGRKTLESMPGGKPLKGRNTIVLSHGMPEGIFWEDGGFKAVCVHSKEDVFRVVEKMGLPEPVVCGGAQIYALFIHDCDELIITEVENETGRADAFFPDFKGEFELREETQSVEESGYRYKISRYSKKEEPKPQK